MENFLNALPRGFRYVFEFRNPTWFCESAYNLLKQHNCSLCIFEIDYFLSPFEITSDFIYVRLHGPEKKYTGLYDKQTLSLWANKCKEWLKLPKDVYMYFDNDQNGYAVLNAITLKNIIFQ